MHAVLEQLFAFATMLVERFGYIGIWLGMTIESAAIPLPSEAIMGLAGFFVFLGKLNLFWAALAGAIGNATGSTILYTIGHRGGKPLMLKYGKYVGVQEEEFKKGEEWLRKYGDKAVFAAQLLPVVRTYVSLPPGVLRMDFKKFIFFTFSGAFVWCYALAFMALKLGQNWHHIENYMKGFQYVVIAAIGAGILFLVINKARGSFIQPKHKTLH
ncbi:DedA family protein [Candidatus Woesebacteria bacterium]|nr:DedA family protein [Candidatus Woesebacteria bacterium]